MRGQPCTDHLGREYPSRLARAKAWGISPVTVDQRIAAGWPVERALTSPPEHSVEAHPVTYQGKNYPSVRALCIAQRVTRIRVIRALRDGASVDDAIEAARPHGGRWARIAAVLDLWRAARDA